MLPASAQYLFLSDPDSLAGFFEKNKTIISLNGGVYQQSNAITNSFVNKFINGGFIDEDLKADQDLSDAGNRFNAGYQFGLEARFVPERLLGSDKYGWMASIYHTDDLSAQFNRDAFNLVFNGNSTYAGRYADLSDTGIRFQRFQQLQFGFFEKSTLSYVSVGILTGTRFLELLTSNSGMFTAEDGGEIALNADGVFNVSDTSQTAPALFNGTGAVINFEINIPVPLKNQSSPAFLRFGGREIGATRWNQRTLSYNADSAYQYSGFIIDDLAALDNLNDQLNQVVDSLLPAGTTGAYLLTTPGWVYASWFSPLGSKFLYELMIRARINAFHLPEGTVRLMYKPGARMLFGINATYGGYGGFNNLKSLRAGIQASAFIGNHFMLSFESTHFTGWINRNALGRNASMSLTYFFGS